MNHKHAELSPAQSQILEVAFIVQDPAGDRALDLAREVVALIRDRDDVTCSALASELRILRAKYTRSGDFSLWSKHTGGTHETSNESRTQKHR